MMPRDRTREKARRNAIAKGQDHERQRRYAEDIGCDIRLILRCGLGWIRTEPDPRPEITRWLKETYPPLAGQHARYVLLDHYGYEIRFRETSDAVLARLRWGEILKTA